MSAPEDELAFQLKAVGIDFEREVQFSRPRKWRGDFVIRQIVNYHSSPDTGNHFIARVPKDLLIEIDGGTWASSRHTTGAGFEADCVKLGEAVVLGYRVIRVTPAMVEDGRALALIERCLA